MRVRVHTWCEPGRCFDISDCFKGGFFGVRRNILHLQWALGTDVKDPELVQVPKEAAGQCR